MNNANQNPSNMLKPWEHRIVLSARETVNFKYEVGTEDTIDDSIIAERVSQIVVWASCTCGQWEQEMLERSGPEEVLDASARHTDMHPLKPVAIVQTGNDNYCIVMAVPGPGGFPVHMSMAISKQDYESAYALEKYFGTIGSPHQFEISRMAETAEGDEDLVFPPNAHLLGPAGLLNWLQKQRHIAEDGVSGVALFDQ